MATLLDSYSESNYDTELSIEVDSSYQFRGQSFTNTNEIELDSAKFYLKKNGSPTGNVYAKIYAITGTSGTDGKPTGSVLATSDAIDVSTLPTSIGLVTFTFSGVNRITLSATTNYVIQCNYNGGDASNYVGFGTDNSSPTDDGNRSFSTDGSTWTANTDYDSIFYVYGGTTEYTAAYTSLAVQATIPAQTATYVYEQTATYTPLSLEAEIPDFTARIRGLSDIKLIVRLFNIKPKANIYNIKPKAEIKNIKPRVKI